MPAQTTIAKLRTDRLALASELVENLRALGLTDEEVVARLRAFLVEKPSLTDAISKALANPGGGITLDGGRMIEALAKTRDARPPRRRTRLLP